VSYKILKDQITSKAVVLLLPFFLIFAACGGGSSSEPDSSTPPPVVVTPPPSSAPITENEAQRFLTKATFGATPESIQRVIDLGYEGWIDEQLSIPQTFLLPIHDAAIEKRTAARRLRLIQEGETDPAILDRGIGKGQRSSSRIDAWWHGAIKGEDQLRQRMAFALSQIFVVGDANGDSALKNRAYSYYYDILGEYGLANYRDLFREVTLTPAMSQFLSLRGSLRQGRPRNGGVTGPPDENFAREAMQLFSIGLVELNIDGTEKLVNGKAVETYEQDLVSEFARIYTGWMMPTGRFYDGWESDQLVPWGGEQNNFHDHGSKVLFNNELVPAGLDTSEDLARAIDSIFNHPNVGPFISKQLIQRFVTSNPSPAYVERIARIFNDNGNGVRGDLTAVIKAILLDDDSLNSHLNNNGGKLKEPIIRITQIWRALDAQSSIEYIRFSLSKRFTGQRALSASSVFNFYEPTYAPSGAIEDAGMVAPEFRLMGDGLLIAYLDKLAQIALSSQFGDINTTYSGSFDLPMNLNLTRAKELSGNFDSLLDYYNGLLFGGSMSSGLRAAVITHLDNIPDQTNAAERSEIIAEEALVLLTASPEFSVQR